MDFSNLKIPKIPDYSEMFKNLDMPTQHILSDTQFEIIKKYIQIFENSLDNEHVVGVMLTNFGQSTLMQVTEITYEKSVVLVFKGYVNDRESTLIQHINQLNFLLTSIPKKENNEKRPIGFYKPEIQSL
jgi:hypothetical protein